MAPQRHRYTKCILFTGQRANKSNERVVCKYCSEAESPQWALQNALLCNTKKLVKSHLRRCRFFRSAQASGEEDIVFTEDEDDSDDDNDSRGKGGKSKTNKSKRPTLAYIGDANNNKSPGDGSKKNESNNKRLKTDATSSLLGKLPRTNGATPAGANASEQDVLERLLLNATLANGWSFAWVDQRASTQLLQYLQPYVRVPSAASLAGRVLKTAGEKEAEAVWSAIEKERIGCTVVLDAWTQVEQHSVLGLILTTSQGEVLVWDSKDVKDAPALVRDNLLQKLVANELAALDSNSVHVVALMADSSDGYTIARRALRRARRDLMVLPCVAHQLNAFIADMFSLVPAFMKTIRVVIDIAIALHRSVDFQTKMWQKHHELEQPQVALSPLPDVYEWETLRTLTLNLLSMKSALKAVVSEEDLDGVLMPAAIRAIGSEDGFWQPLVDLDSILFHVARWIAIIKLHQGRLHYIPIVKHSIAATLQHQLAPEVGSPLLERLEARWDEWEHPLMILAVVLNPAFGWKHIDSSSGVTLMRLSCWARYYFESFFGSQPHNLPNEVVEYVEGDKFWCSPASIASFSTPVYRTPTSNSENDQAAQDDAELFARLSFKAVQYWKSCSTDCPELSKLALRIFAVSVTTASTDALFESAASMKSTTSPSSDRSSHLLLLAATRVRARAKYEQRHDGVSGQLGAALRSASDDEATGEDTRHSSGEAYDKLQAIEYAKIDKLLSRWRDQAIQNIDQDVDRVSSNENEAINSMYDKIHPTDDKFSKYSIQTLFQSE